MPTVTTVSSEGAKGELSCCQQMLSMVLFITYPAENASYYYTHMQCQAAAGAYSKPTVLLRLIPMIFGPVRQTTNRVPACIKMTDKTSSLNLHPSELICVRRDEESASPRFSSTSRSSERNLRLFGYSSDCLKDAFPVVWTTVPVLTILASSHE